MQGERANTIQAYSYYLSPVLEEVDERTLENSDLLEGALRPREMHDGGFRRDRRTVKEEDSFINS